MDKRFWSGAVAVVTVVIAGAGVLPSLLLRPAVDDDPMAGSVEPAPFMSKPVKLVDYEPPRPVVAVLQAAVRLPEATPGTRAGPKPPGVVAAVPPPAATVQVAAVHAVVPLAPQTKPLHEVSAAAVPSTPPMTTAAMSSAARVAVAAAFPPIQPVGVAAQSGIDAKPKVVAAPLDITARPVRQVRAAREKVVRQAASRERAKPRRSSRPAPFPIRQFLLALRR